MANTTSRVPQAYWFGGLPDRAVMQELRRSHEHDRATTARLIALLAELEKRRPYLAEGYASLYKYCVGALHMSEDVAWKRIEASRAARRHPEIFELLADGRLHLSAVVLLRRHLTRENAGELLEAASHRSKRAIEDMLAARFPQPDLATLVTPVMCTSPAVSVAATGTPSTAVQHDATNPAPGRVPDLSCPTSATEATAPDEPFASAAPPARVAPLAPSRFALQVTIGADTHELLREAQALLAHALPAGDLDRVLHRALLDLVLRLRARKFGAAKNPRDTTRRGAPDERHIPAAIRRAVAKRDGQRCTFISEAGHRCDERSRLEFDHVRPVARGGLSTAANLRPRCRAHNRLEAERVYGVAFMTSRLETSVRARDARSARPAPDAQDSSASS